MRTADIRIGERYAAQINVRRDVTRVAGDDVGPDGLGWMELAIDTFGVRVARLGRTHLGAGPFVVEVLGIEKDGGRVRVRVAGTFTAPRTERRREDHLDGTYTVWTGKVFDADGEPVRDTHPFEAVVAPGRITDLLGATVAAESRQMERTLQAVESGLMRDPFDDGPDDDD